MIISFGSINMDLTMKVAEFPKPGETILTSDYEMSPGGKGANQALAAARAGVKTAMVGAVGDDGMGQRLLHALRRNEVMTSGVAVSETLSTGIAIVTTNAAGENQITVAQGANSAVSAEQVPDEILKPGNLVMFQMEVPLSENIAVMERAKKHGATVMLNLAPALMITQKALSLVDYLVVNELEARHIAQTIGLGGNMDLMVIARALAKLGNLDCIVTLGAEGSLAMSANGKGWRVPSYKVDNVVDTTGSGDCYCGTLAAALHSKLALGSAMRRASIAASLSVTKPGAQDSYPYAGEIEEILQTFPQAQPC